MKNSSIKTVVAVGIGAAISLVLSFCAAVAAVVIVKKRG